MATNYPNNFKVELNQPLDTRVICNQLSDLTSYLYVGLLTYCKEDGKYYSCTAIDAAGVPTWEEIAADVLQSKNLLKNSNFDDDITYISSQSYWKYVSLGGSSTVDVKMPNYYNNCNFSKIKYLTLGQDIILERGKTYTLSFYYNMEYSSGDSRAFVDYGHGIMQYCTLIQSSSNITTSSTGLSLNYIPSPASPELATITFTVKEDLEEEFINTTLTFGTQAQSDDSLCIGCFQLEEGDTATEYSRYEENFATIDDINKKQEKLVSGTNIKTINGQSILGDGNIEVSTSVESPLHYLGVTTTEMYDGYLSPYVTINGVSIVAESGSVVFYGDNEYVYNGSVWEELGGTGGTYGTTLGDLAMPNTVGGISAGTTAESLKTKTFTQLFDDLLFPSVNPTHTDPSVSGFVLNPTTSPVKIGSSVASISAATLNKGYWLEYNNNLAYAGDVTAITYSITINGSTYTDISSLPSTYTTPGNQTYRAVITYGAGPTPVNNKGVEQPDLAAPANTTGVSATRYVNVTYPYYILQGSSDGTFNSDGNFTEYVKQCTISGSTGTITIPQGAILTGVKNDPSITVLKVYGALESIGFVDPNSGKRVEFLSELGSKAETDSEGTETGYTLYFYPSGVEVGNRTIYGATIKFTI